MNQLIHKQTQVVGIKQTDFLTILKSSEINHNGVKQLGLFVFSGTAKEQTESDHFFFAFQFLALRHRLGLEVSIRSAEVLKSAAEQMIHVQT